MQKFKLNLPDFEFKTKFEKNDELIFDPIRKKYIILTDEEWVRQNILRYLVDFLKYPQSLLGVEKQIKVFNTIKRPDIIVFNNNLKPKMIVECKRPQIDISNDTLNQAINYFIELKADYFLLTNGLKHFCCKIENNSCKFLEQIPTFDKL
ncbi:MAG: type I restriction enzyme HsdR N-terminal domain-containing protein [Bacteroidales bacterium]|nr:type I restriction enzyme HsdR N-terminal domain-containing protein [Bacteroidales bacterium]